MPIRPVTAAAREAAPAQRLDCGVTAPGGGRCHTLHGGVMSPRPAAARRLQSAELTLLSLLMARPAQRQMRTPRHAAAPLLAASPAGRETGRHSERRARSRRGAVRHRRRTSTKTAHLGDSGARRPRSVGAMCEPGAAEPGAGSGTPGRKWEDRDGRTDHPRADPTPSRRDDSAEREENG